MSYLRLTAGLMLAACAFAADPKLDALLKSVEARYNKAKTLQVLFKEEYTPQGKPRRMENGLLMLRKPGKMRMDYAQPNGKQFVSDGRTAWIYTPDENRVEKMKLEETEDMRAPLAFLLGKLKFDKEFRNLTSRSEGELTRILAEPRTENLPYTNVEFLVASDSSIREVKTTNFDHSTLVIRFEQEKLDPPLDSKIFDFQVPKGATVEGAD